MVTYSEFQTQDPQILGATVQKFVNRATGHPGFVKPEIKTPH
jgi:hypothetical protein